MVAVLPLCGEVLPLLLKSILSLVILHSHIPRLSIPLAVIVKSVVLILWVVEGSVLPIVLVEIIPWLVIPVVILVRSIISAIRWLSVVAVLVSIIVWGAVLSSISVCVILLSLLWLFSCRGGFFYC